MGSPVDADPGMTCNACGASVYRDHLHRGLAGMWAGQLLCPTCLKDRRSVAAQSDAPTPTEAVPLAPEEDESQAGLPGSAEAPVPTGAAASSPGGTARAVRTFHAKLSDAAIRHMDAQVNAWLTGNPNVEIKFATTTVGVFESKHAEPNLILTIFY